MKRFRITAAAIGAALAIALPAAAQPGIIPIYTKPAVVTTVYSPDTNYLFVTGAGTNAANGKYKLKGSAFTAGLIYTNFTGTGVCCRDLSGIAGSQDGTLEQHPFYMGATTNNDMTCWYYSHVHFLTGWATNDDNVSENPLTAAAGIGGLPTVRYGTNLSYITNTFVTQEAFLKTMASNKVVIVSQTNGHDVSALTWLLPFRTLRAARAVATNGWTIEVMDGTFSETNLLKNGVHWHFHDGTVVGYVGNRWDARTPVFSDVGLGAITCNITGDIFRFYSFSCDGNDGMLFTNPATRINMEFNEADVGAWVQSSSSPILAAARKHSLCTVSNCGYLNMKFKVIGNRSASTTYPGHIWNPAENNYGKSNVLSAYDMGFYWQQGEQHIEFDKMVCKVGERHQAAFWSEAISNALTGETHWYIKGEDLQGLIYFNGANPLARVWINIVNHVSTNTTPYFPYGYEKVYITSQKIGSATSCFNFNGGAGHEIWINVQKLSGKAGWLDVGSGTHKVFATVQEYEDTSTATNGLSSTSPGIHVGNGPITLTINGGRAVSGSGPILKIDQNTTNVTVNGMWMDSGLNGSTNAPIWLLGAAGRSGLHLQGCWLLSGSTNAIYAANSKFVGFNGVIANKTNHANVVQSPGTNGFAFDSGLTR